MLPEPPPGTAAHSCSWWMQGQAPAHRAQLHVMASVHTGTVPPAIAVRSLTHVLMVKPGVKALSQWGRTGKTRNQSWAWAPTFGGVTGLASLGAQGPPALRSCIQGSTTKPHPCYAGLLIQSQASQGELRDSTGRVCRLYLDLELRRLGEDRPQLRSQPDSRLLFPMLPRR